MTADPIKPGTHVIANGYDATVLGYDVLTDLYSVQMYAMHPEVVMPDEIAQPTEFAVYQLRLKSGATLVAQKIGPNAWVTMGSAALYGWPPVKHVTGWDRLI